VVLKPHALKRRAATYTKAKLACIQNVIYFSVPLDSIFRLNFANSLPVVDRRLIGRKF
jgi:hypothetical protein